MHAPELLGLLTALIVVVGNAIVLYSIRAALSGAITPDTPGGIRTWATRTSSAAWEAGHRAAWPWALALNGAALVAALIAGACAWTVMPFLVALGAALVLSIAGAVVQLVVAHRAAQHAGA